MADNFTASTRQGWVTEPDGRGSWSILSTCLLTIILCCWTAVLPNIPARTDKWYHRLRDRLHLASIGVLGPEFLLMLALGQWSSARASVKVRQIPCFRSAEPDLYARLNGPLSSQSLEIRATDEKFHGSKYTLMDPCTCLLCRHGRLYPRRGGKCDVFPRQC